MPTDKKSMKTTAKKAATKRKPKASGSLKPSDTSGRNAAFAAREKALGIEELLGQLRKGSSKSTKTTAKKAAAKDKKPLPKTTRSSSGSAKAAPRKAAPRKSASTASKRR